MSVGIGISSMVGRVDAVPASRRDVTVAIRSRSMRDRIIVLNSSSKVSDDGLIGGRGRVSGSLGMSSFSTHAVHCPDTSPKRWRVLSFHCSVV